MHEERNTQQQWLQQLARGEDMAFRQLFDLYHAFIFSFAYKMTASEQIAKDIVQEVMIKVWINRHTLTEIENLPAYINRITRNLVLNGLKRRAHESLLLREIIPANPARNSTEETTLHRELEHLLHKALTQLPPQQQRVYRMSRIEGLHHEEIASKLNISKETVKKHMMAALRTLKDHLRQHGSTITILAICLLDTWQ
ncbi:RNA polymerase sigma-70 factor [Chitinophaga pendula]|uniref:RNA polymerase sigma factor n=1 Tax=Chitinophaga TaxID=79328 RepID=UPI000BAFA908|nr:MULTISPECIES: RNA polymerase sigma-70 factor [Chitinophaga]ASZ12028.1 hypothetical protein CK934_14190 [Chitinophaga sp. MD30]UCJ04939.1 RNA polymerase sigma-70 factor [Chitinophaga pendula]